MDLVDVGTMALLLGVDRDELAAYARTNAVDDVLMLPYAWLESGRRRRERVVEVLGREPSLDEGASRKPLP